MALLAPFDRSSSPALPPVPVPAIATAATRAQRLETGRFLVHALLGNAGSRRAWLAQLEASVDERVVAWSPTLHTTSRTQLVQALLEGDDAIADLDVAIVGELAGDVTSYIEWQMRGRFVNSGFIDDDVLVEASGGRVGSSGVLVLAFTGTRVAAIRCYYDRLALRRQMI